MLDTIKFYIPMRKAVVRKIFASGNEKPKISRRLMAGKSGKRFEVRSADKGRAIMIEMSLLKLLQGHNVCGTNRLSLMCREVVRVVYRGLGLRLTSTERKRIGMHDFELGRVDATGSYNLRSQENVKAAMEEIRVQLKALGLDIVVHEGPGGIETIYVGKNSRRATFKFYNKYLELVDTSALSPKLRGHDEILQYVKGHLRIELTLRSTELNEIEMGGGALNVSSSWSEKIVRALLLKRMAQFKFSGLIKTRLDANEIDGLKPNHKMLYDLHRGGADLQRHMPRHTYRRWDKKMYELYGIRIGRPVKMGAAKVSLSKLLAPDQLHTTWPKKLRETGAIYIPRHVKG